MNIEYRYSPQPLRCTQDLAQEHRLSQALWIEQVFGARAGTFDTRLYERVDVFVVKLGVANLGVRHHGALHRFFERHDPRKLATNGIVPCCLFGLSFDGDFQLLYLRLRLDLEAELSKDLLH